MDTMIPTERRAMLRAASPWQALADTLRRITGRWRERRALRMHLEAVAQLDDATLRDIGLRHAEAASYWAEAQGWTEATRLRIARPFAQRAEP